MKLSRDGLKDLVKECLVEILNEGLDGLLSRQSTQTNREIPMKVSRPVFSEGSKGRPVQDNIPQRKPSTQLREAVRRESGGNKIMEEILSHTAEETLPKMLASESRTSSRSVSGGLAEQVIAAASPEDIFGDDVTSKWANLAFSDSPTKK